MYNLSVPLMFCLETVYTVRASVHRMGRRLLWNCHTAEFIVKFEFFREQSFKELRAQQSMR